MEHFSKSAMISKMNNLLELLLKITRSTKTAALFEDSMSQFKWIVNFDHCQYVHFNQDKQAYCCESITYASSTNLACSYHRANAEFEQQLGMLYKQKNWFATEFNNLPLLSDLLNWRDMGAQCLFAISLSQKSDKTSALLFFSKGDAFRKDDKVLMSIFANLMLLNISSIKDLQEKEIQLEHQQEIIDETATDLEVRIQELALANKYKSEFLSNMSHELRSPLNSILLLTQALITNKKQHFDDTEIEDLQVIRRGGQSLQLLIDNIMDLSKVEAGKLTLHIKPLKLSQLANYLHQAITPLAAEKELSFSISLDKNLPAEIVSDESRLAQVLRNLLFNAIKFTPQGSIRLTIAPTEPGIKFTHIVQRADSSLTFAVTDSGIGIPRYKQQAIFESFQQVDGSDSRHYGGTGLGLTISRGITHLLGGDIQVQSSYGSGSTFSIHLPIDFNATYQSEEHAKTTSNTVKKAFQGVDQPSVFNYENQEIIQVNKKTAKQHDQAQIQQLKKDYQSLIANKILLLDSDMRACFSLSKKLIEIGFDVDFCASASEAKDIYQDHNYQLLLVEQHLIISAPHSVSENIRKLLIDDNSIIISMNNPSKQKNSYKNLILEVNGQLDIPVDIGKLLSLMNKLLSS
ncbi:MAG: ATP-binding protein [Pseudomonadales bacterium]|nr:ATP-binding protein [Pseudomonadales bacterium]NRA16725.1 hypothetical protein [Oceanospirillaceae bacterium]